MPILYEYLQRNRGHKRPSMTEVVRYIKAYYKTFAKLTEERHPGRKFFDPLFEYQIPKFEKMEVLTEDLLDMIQKAKNSPGIFTIGFSPSNTDSSVNSLTGADFELCMVDHSSSNRKRSRSKSSNARRKAGKISSDGGQENLGKAYFKPSPRPNNNILQLQLNLQSRNRPSQQQSSEMESKQSLSSPHSIQKEQTYKLDLQLEVAV